MFGVAIFIRIALVIIVAGLITLALYVHAYHSE